ncbi:MAG: BlaI/MecI/CopY family transcriptional regulator [Thermoplasmatales archaeon]|nr:BlaI/MecI/CopY family transcriptional regulator [Thermoplasmatales archaeon]
MTKNVGPLERKVLGILWRKKEATAREICISLEQSGERRAYSTIRTIIKRLVQKKIIDQHKNHQDRKYTYTPILTKCELEAKIVQRIFGDLLEKFEQSTINYLSEELSDNEEEIEKIKKRLAEMKQDD